MARQITEEVAELVKDLITDISGFEEGTEVFSHIQKHILTTLKKADTMYFLNKKEVDRNIASMAEKFIFHGFSREAKALQDSYKDYVLENLPEYELVGRLNIVKLLLCLSERPTSKFLENPHQFKTETVEEEEEEDINWGEYLKEGIDTWWPNVDVTSEESDGSVTEDRTRIDEIGSGDIASARQIIIDSRERDTVVDFRTSRTELLATVQHTWYNQKHVRMFPFSNWREANIGILWDQHLEKQVMGLIPIQKSSVLSEYKVIREILWQMWSLHTSAVFELDENTVKPKSGVTIASVRAECLENYLQQFIPYMEVLDFFREFSRSLEIRSEESINTMPCTYRSYNDSLLSIIRPIYRRLSELEDMVREQEVTYTLLKLSSDLQSIMVPVMLLKKIHDEVVIDFKANSTLRCATVLICRLHNSLQYSVSKLEQDLRVTLFLDTLYHYFSLINSWLVKNYLSDYSEEFVIMNKNQRFDESTYQTDNGDRSTSSSENWMLNFELRDELDDICAQNGMMKIIRETVLQIGRNIHLLLLLDIFSVKYKNKETIHKEFVRRCLEELENFFNVESGTSKETTSEETFFDSLTEKKYKYPVVCTEDCKRPTEFDKLENLVDTTDGFLMLAFEDFFVEKPKTPPEEEESLFEKVSKITTTMFPTSNFFERIFSDLLKERFTTSGLMVKKILIEKYLLEKQFEFLRHMFLFQDDLIFSFYRRLFEQTSGRQKNAGNTIWLTSHLQDVIVDIYPDFYRGCRVQSKHSGPYNVHPFNVCTDVEIQYEIQWPLNLIITSPQMVLYKDVFKFIMHIKWALYTINHLAFTDLEPKKLNKNQPKTHTKTIMKLKYLRFSLTNLLSTIQHYIFSFVFTKCLQKFELDFEKANDLASIMASHADFISTSHAMMMEVRQSGRDFPAFKNVVDCVKLLKSMWTNLELATGEQLENCYSNYKMCYKAINPIVCPVYIFDY